MRYSTSAGVQQMAKVIKTKQSVFVALYLALENMAKVGDLKERGIACSVLGLREGADVDAAAWLHGDVSVTGFGFAATLLAAEELDDDVSLCEAVNS